MKRSTMLWTVSCVVGFALLHPVGFAAEQLSADEVANKASLAAYYAGQDGRAKVLMTILDAQGRSRTRMMSILRHDVKDGGE